MSTQNIITIEPIHSNGNVGSTLFGAPTDNQVAWQLWVFLVENLQPGFVVKLSNETSELTYQSGRKLPLDMYKGVMQ